MAQRAWAASQGATAPPARLADPAADCAFDELGFDSLARMELCIWLQIEAGLEVTEGEVLDHPSVAALAAHLAARG